MDEKLIKELKEKFLQNFPIEFTAIRPMEYQYPTLEEYHRYSVGHGKDAFLFHRRKEMELPALFFIPYQRSMVSSRGLQFIEMGKKAEEVGNDQESTSGAEAFSVENTGVQSEVPQLKTMSSSSIKTFQNAADDSQNVSQLKEIDTLANKRDKSGIKQLQRIANGSLTIDSPIQKHSSSPNEIDSLTSNYQDQESFDNQSDINPESIEI